MLIAAIISPVAFICATSILSAAARFWSIRTRSLALTSASTGALHVWECLCACICICVYVLYVLAHLCMYLCMCVQPG